MLKIVVVDRFDVVATQNALAEAGYFYQENLYKDGLVQITGSSIGKSEIARHKKREQKKWREDQLKNR